jgi:hypothetical protein
MGLGLLFLVGGLGFFEERDELFALQVRVLLARPRRDWR